MDKNQSATKEQALFQKYKNIQAECSEMSDFIKETIEDCNRYETDLRYLEAFIHYKKLDEEYRYFRENAREEYDEELPFSKLTL
jgi:hypothetical protein